MLAKCPVVWLAQKHKYTIKIIWAQAQLNYYEKDLHHSLQCLLTSPLFFKQIVKNDIQTLMFGIRVLINCFCNSFQVYSYEGRISFTSHTPGEHGLCLYSNSTKWIGGTQLVNINCLVEGKLVNKCWICLWKNFGFTKSLCVDHTTLLNK